MEKYDDVHIVGKGQYGTAYRARDKRDGQLYCIKRIPMSAKDDHAGALREAQLLDSLDHPNIIRYRESFVDKDGSLCIVTSFCEEGDLFTRIRKKASQKEYFTEQEVMNLFVQIASAISYIHSKRVLHRDLKTQNIFLARGGIVKLGDFGISKVLERTDAFATTVTGTPYYMAPEICTNQPYTYKSDIWSLGCVLYELCTLKHAFAADSLLSLVYQIVRGNFPPIPNDQFSPGLSDLVNRLLARDAAARPSLGEVFKLPYVQQHLERFKAEEQRRNLKQSTSMARRKQLLESAPGAGGHSENDANLTPRQRVERKKAMDRERRELEMRLAAMSANKNREQAAARKKEMIFGSNVVLPGAQQQQQQQQQQQAGAYGGGGGGGFEDDELPNMGTVRVAEESSRGPPTRGGGGNRGIWDVDDVDPYAATLPSQARMQQQQQAQPAQGGAAQRPYTQQAGVRGSTAAGASGRPATVASPQQYRPASGLGGSRGGGRGMWDADGDDDVLTGTMRAGDTRMGTRPGLQATAGAMERSGGGAGPGGQWGGGGTWDRNGMSGLSDDMPNMGTMQMSHGPGQLPPPPQQTHGSPAAARPLEFSVANRTASSDSPLMGSVNLGNSRTLRTGAAAAAAPLAAAGTLGGAGRPVSGGGGGILAAERTASPYSAASSRSSPYSGAGSPYNGGAAGGGGGGSPSPAGRQAAGPAAGPSALSPQRQAAHQGQQQEEEEDDGGYSDDFEDDDEDEGVAQQRNRIIQNVEDMASRAYDGRDSIAAVKERVLQSVAKSDKVRTLHQKGLAELGPKFEPVYDYLSRVRRQEPAPEEREVQRRLLEIVGDRTRMPGCFTVDQLVFTEQMYMS